MAKLIPNQLTVNGKPLDERVVVANEAAISAMTFAYIGLIVYAEAEDKVFVVKSLKNGYEDFNTGKLTPVKPDGEEEIDYNIVSNAFIDQYAEITGASAVAAAMSIKVNENVYEAENGVIDLSDINAASVGGYSFTVLTQAEYDAIAEKDPNVFYAVSDAVEKIDESATYANLNTTDKTIIGALNELKAAIDALNV